MHFKTIFGQRLREIRIKNHETQQDLTDFLGAAKNSVSEIENGKRTTTAEKIALICAHYRISADYLLGLSDDPTPR